MASEVLVILILEELFRLLLIYLQEHQISVGVAVEVAIVSILREVIVRGALTVPWSELLGTCALLLVLAVLLRVRPWMQRRSDTKLGTENYPASEANQK